MKHISLSNSGYCLTVSRRWTATLGRTLLVVSSQRAAIKYVSRGESYSTWKFHQRDSDHYHRSHLTETEENRITLRRLQSPSSLFFNNFRSVRRKTSFLLPQIDANRTYCDESGIWKVHKVNLRASVGEEKTTQFWVLIQSQRLPSTRTRPLLTLVPYGVLSSRSFFRFSSPSALRPSLLSHSPSFTLSLYIFLFSILLRLLFVEQVCNPSKVRIPDLQKHPLSAQWSSYSVRNFDLSSLVSHVRITCAHPSTLLENSSLNRKTFIYKQRNFALREFYFKFGL